MTKPILYHYVYMMSFKDSYYIGSRTCQCLPADDVHYLSSSKLIKHLQHYGIEFEKKILGMYDTKNEAFRTEQDTIRQVITHKECINLATYGFFLKDADHYRKIAYLSKLSNISLDAWCMSRKVSAHNKAQKEQKKNRKKQKMFKQRESLRPVK